ncbi:MAG: hypothetical protein Q6K99_06685 [Thermostichales cyanobacterium BF4_bins_65]
MVTLEGVAVLGALVVAIVGIIWILNIIKATLWAGLSILAILLLLYFGFGITPASLWDALIHLPEHLQRWIDTFG